MKHDLKQRYPGAALITGASAGLGEAFARALAAEGMDLVLVARREERLREIAAQLEKAHGIRVASVALDLSLPDAAQSLAQQVASLGWTVSLLVNNAGFGSMGPFETLDPAGEARMVDLNCRAAVAVTAAFLPGMVQRRNGAIIFLASTAAYQPVPFMSTYAATKAFNLIFAEGLWGELRGRGVDVLALSPGYTVTEFQERAKMTFVPPRAFWAQAPEVVETALRALGRRPSVVHAWYNKIPAFLVRLVPRRSIPMIVASGARPKN